jgi:hypothetical protein
VLLHVRIDRDSNMFDGNPESMDPGSPGRVPNTWRVLCPPEDYGETEPQAHSVFLDRDGNLAMSWINMPEGLSWREIVKKSLIYTVAVSTLYWVMVAYTPARYEHSVVLKLIFFMVMILLGLRFFRGGKASHVLSTTVYFHTLKFLMLMPNCMEISIPHGETTTRRWSPKKPPTQVVQLIWSQPATVNEVGKVIIEWPRKPVGVSVLVGFCRILKWFIFTVLATMCIFILVLFSRLNPGPEMVKVVVTITGLVILCLSFLDVVRDSLCFYYIVVYSKYWIARTRLVLSGVCARNSRDDERLLSVDHGDGRRQELDVENF